MQADPVALAVLRAAYVPVLSDALLRRERLAAVLFGTSQGGVDVGGRQIH